VSFPWLFLKIFVKFSISQNWTKKKNIPGFGYIYRNQYFIYLYFFCDVAEVVMSMKEGSLFCFVVMRSTKPGCFMLQIMFLVSLESSRRGGMHGLGSMMFRRAVQKFLVVENFGGNEMCLWCFWKDLDE
jgi:hypothetical protein